MSTDTLQVFHREAMWVGESPLWSAGENALYWIDIPRCTVHCKNLDTLQHRTWDLPSEPGCIARRSGGGLIVAMRSGVAFLDTESGELSMLAQAPYDTDTMRFNDGRCDATGRFWMGTMYEPRDRPSGSLYSLDRGRLVHRGNAVTVSNGLAFSPDFTVMYHADTTAHAIYRCQVDPGTGNLTRRETFATFSSDRCAEDYGGRPDGAAVDSEGAYWIAMFEGARLLRFSPDAVLLQEIRLPVRCPTMLTFGGDDLRTLFITTASQNRTEAELRAHPFTGYVLSQRVDVPGLPEPAYQA